MADCARAWSLWRVSTALSAGDAAETERRERTSGSRGRPVWIGVLPLLEQVFRLADKVLPSGISAGARRARAVRAGNAPVAGGAR